MSESVKELISGRVRTEGLKRKFEESARSRWNGRGLKEIFGEELMPRQLSVRFLEAINVLSKQVEDSEEARELLLAARDYRL